MHKLIVRLLAALGLLASVALTAPAARAATDCVFVTSGTTMTLTADCITDATIVIPDGFTLDGAGHTITGVDPAGDHFRGAVVQNGGAVAHIYNLTVTVGSLANACDGGADRLRGVMLEGASGSIQYVTVANLNQGPSGCQEGNAIEVRNAPFDGTHPNTQVVEIAHNTVSSFQKTGILVNGDVVAEVHHNYVGASATQANLAANGVQFGFGAGGSLHHNQIAGNSWCCSDAAATAILLFDSAPVNVSHNTIGGNADVGIYVLTDGATVAHNLVVETGADGFYDIGIGDYGAGNTVTKNKVGGYDLAYEGVVGGKNKTLPSP